MTSLSRFLVVDESERGADCSPGSPGAPRLGYADLGADIGAALNMPSAAQTVALEQCNMDEFVLWRGSWECFSAVQGNWPEKRRKLRLHRLALLDVDRDEEREQAELIRPAFSLPFMSRFQTGRGKKGGYIYGRRDIVSLLDLESTDFCETEHFQIIYGGNLTLPELIATYLRKYWEVLGQ
jgi:hypothetical protein